MENILLPGSLDLLKVDWSYSINFFYSYDRLSPCQLIEWCKNDRLAPFWPNSMLIGNQKRFLSNLSKNGAIF